MSLTNRINLKRVPNVNDLPGLDLPWAQHHVRAMLDGAEIGFTRIVYVPREAYDAYPDKKGLAERYYGSRYNVKGWARKYVDQPKIDMAKVHSKSNRRSGVGTALYLESAKWMKQLGLPICSCPRKSQSADAIAIWNYLKRHYPTDEKGQGDQKQIYLRI